MERWLKSIYSDGTDVFFSPPYPHLRQNLTIRLRVSKQNPLKNIYLRTAPEGEEIFLPMKLYKEDDFFHWKEL